MRRLLLCLVGLFSLFSVSPIYMQDDPPDAYVIALDLPLRIYSAPSTQTDVSTVLNPGTPLAVIGRTRDSEWLDVRASNSDEGWMMAEFADVRVDLHDVPVATDLESLPYEEIELSSVVIKRLHKIFQAGQDMGNRADVFSKVGDSITAAPHMLRAIGENLYNLGDFQYLQGVIDFFSVTEARDGQSSFNNTSLAAGVGWPAHAAVDAEFADPGLCKVGESPLVCEYRLIRPSIALIMFGTNDVSRFSADIYEGNLQQIVQTSIRMGVIPIISTIPNRLGFEDQVAEYNQVIVETADRFSIPLWDFYAAMEALPDEGLTLDGTHPTIPPHGYRGSADFRARNLYYGYVMRNLTALQMLDAVWRAVAR